MRLVKPSWEIMPHLPYPQMLDNVCHMIGHCYKADAPTVMEEQEAFIQARLRKHHDSVIEHVGFSVDFVVDRGITHELVRHRISSPTQESTRYCNYSMGKFGEHVTFVMPPFVSAHIPEGEYVGLRKTNFGTFLLPKYTPEKSTDHPLVPDQAVYLWLDTMLSAGDSYLRAVSSVGGSMPPEIARGMLPHATKADFGTTANMRQWRTVFKQRALGITGRPHPQMLEVMEPLFEECIRRFPAFFKDLDP